MAAREQAQDRDVHLNDNIGLQKRFHCHNLILLLTGLLGEWDF